MTDDRPLLEHSQAAARLGISSSMLHKLVENKLIRAGRTTRGFKVYDQSDLDPLALSYEEIEALIQRKKQTATTPRRESNEQQASRTV